MKTFTIGVLAFFSFWGASDCTAISQFNKEHAFVLDGAIGKSVCANKHFEQEDLIIIGWGEVSPVRGQHTIQVDTDLHITPEEPFVWLNHSCNPNCGLLINTQLSEMELHALRTIQQNEELTVDYATFEWEIDFMPQKCLCGSDNCRKQITGYKDLPQTIRKNYGFYIAPYLQNFSN